MSSVSVIVPAWNAQRTLATAVRSALRAAKQVEVVVVDDGSTDATASIACRLAQEHGSVRVVSQPNRGLAAARNAGLDVCSGKWVVFLDADDALLPGSLEAALRAAESASDAGVVCCWWFVPEERFDAACALAQRGVDEPEIALLAAAWRGAPAAGGLDAAALALRNLAPVHALLTRREAIGSARFDESLEALEDWAFWRALAARGARWSSCAVATALYRLCKESMSRDPDRMLKAAARVLRSEPRRCEALAQLAVERAAMQLAQRDGPQARTQVQRLLREHVDAAVRIEASTLGGLLAHAYALGARTPLNHWLEPCDAWLASLAWLLDELQRLGVAAAADREAVAQAVAAAATPSEAVASSLLEAAGDAPLIEAIGAGANGLALCREAARRRRRVRLRDLRWPDAAALQAARRQLAHTLGAVELAPATAPLEPAAQVVYTPSSGEPTAGALSWRQAQRRLADQTARRLLAAIR